MAEIERSEAQAEAGSPSSPPALCSPPATELDALLEAAFAAHLAWCATDGDDEDLDPLITLHTLGKDGAENRRAAADYVVDRGLALLRGGDPSKQIFAIRLIREMHRDAEVADALLASLRCATDPDVVSWCIGGLAFRGNAEAVATLATFVNHPDENLRYRLAGALSSCEVSGRAGTAWDGLLVLADDEVADVRYSALYELSVWWQHENLRDPRVRARLIQGLDDADEGVRRTCGEAFEPSGSRG